MQSWYGKQIFHSALTNLDVPRFLFIFFLLRPLICFSVLVPLANYVPVFFYSVSSMPAFFYIIYAFHLVFSFCLQQFHLVFDASTAVLVPVIIIAT